MSTILSPTIDYRYISVLSDDILQELITAHELIRRDSNNPLTRAELAAIRIFAAFAWGVKKWDDGLLERSRLAVNGNESAANGDRPVVNGNGPPVNGNGMNGIAEQSGGGVGEGHRILGRLVEKLKEDEGEDPLLSSILAECLKIGRPGRPV